MVFSNKLNCLVIFSVLGLQFIINVKAGKQNCKEIPLCHLAPESFIGPYYLPLNISRSNITENEPGIPIDLKFIVTNSATCEPIPNAVVDIWQANATGTYSGFARERTGELTFLRGIQVSNTLGEVTFHSIYPGWYTPRAVHIHMEVYIAGQVKHIGRVYFPDIYTDAVRRVYPYTMNTKEIFWNKNDTNYDKEMGNFTTFVNIKGITDTGFKANMYVGINISGSEKVHHSGTGSLDMSLILRSFLVMVLLVQILLDGY